MLLIPTKIYLLILRVNFNELAWLSFIGKVFFVLTHLDQSPSVFLVYLLQSSEVDTFNFECFSFGILQNHHILRSSMGKQSGFLLNVWSEATIAHLAGGPMLFVVLFRMANLRHLAIATWRQVLKLFACVSSLI